MLKTAIYLISFFTTMYAMSGIDFNKMTRKQGESRVFLLSILISMGVAYLVAEFLLGLTIL